MSVFKKATNILRRAERAEDPVWEKHVKWELYVRATLWLVVAGVLELTRIRVALQKGKDNG